MILATPIVAASALAAAAADTAANGFDPWSLLTTGGPVGILVVIVWFLVTGRLHTDGEVKRLIAELDAARTDQASERAARIALQTTLIEQVVPALTRSTDAVTRSTDVMETLARRQVGGG